MSCKMHNSNVISSFGIGMVNEEQSPQKMLRLCWRQESLVFSTETGRQQNASGGWKSACLNALLVWIGQRWCQREKVCLFILSLLVMKEWFFCSAAGMHTLPVWCILVISAHAHCIAQASLHHHERTHRLDDKTRGMEWCELRTKFQFTFSAEKAQARVAIT